MITIIILHDIYIKGELLMNLDKKVCFCMKVTNGDIYRAVQDGATTFEEVQEKTNVSRGCRRCTDDVKRLIEEFVKERDM